MRSSTRGRFGPIVRFAPILAALALFAPPAGEAAAASLFPNPVYAVGTNPYGMARADFDGDGHDDLIVSNATQEYYNGGTGDLSLLRGLGDGTFAAEVRIPVSHHPTDAQSGDFNGDGAQDVVYTSWQGAMVLYGHGDGTFGPDVALPGTPGVARVAHFDADALTDLLVVEGVHGDGNVRALLGQPANSFLAGSPILSGLSGLPTVTDIDADGFDDVVLITGTFGPCSIPQTNTLRLFRGNGAGGFVESASFGTGLWNQSMIPADLDGDAHVDLVVTAIQYQNCSGYSGRRIFYGNGDWAFTAAGPFELQVNTFDLVASDFDHDGFMDWLESDGGAITVHLGHGDRTWTDLPWFVTGPNGDAISAGDDDGDGELDLAILANFSEAVFTYLGNGDGTFGPPRIPALASVTPTGAATADFDGDGTLDLAASSFDSGEVVVVPGTGNGGFGAEARHAVGEGPDDLATADFNGDGAPDIAVTVDHWAIDPPETYPDGGLVLLINDGAGGFAPAVGYPSGKNPIALATADLDLDGAMDVVVANWGGGYLGEHGDLSVYFGNGDGTLQSQTRLPVGVIDNGVWDPTTPASVATGDFNGDGHPDIVVAMRGTNNSTAEGEVEILYGDGAGGFDPFTTVLGVPDAESVAIGDLNADGLADIAVADMASQLAYDPGGVRILFSHGDGTFTASALLAAGPGPFDVRIDDFDLDGVPDLAVNNNGGFLALLPGLGGGAFGPHLDFGLFGVPLSIVKGDFDGDGSPDFLVLTFSGAFLFRNASAPPPPRLEISGSIVVGEGAPRRSATVRWTTNAETDLASFNLVLRDQHGDRLLNTAPIACAECTTGDGHEYSYFLPKHKKTLFIEAVHTDGRTELFGPIERDPMSPGPPGPSGGRRRAKS